MIPKLQTTSIKPKKIGQLITNLVVNQYGLIPLSGLSARAGMARPMMFIGQIAIDENVFDISNKKMAYIFVTHKDHPDETFVDPDIIYPDRRVN